jgi:hypothetical protein
MEMTDMERIPESFKLTEDDIKEAIAYWLNSEHGNGDGYDSDFDIEFDVQVKREVPKGAPYGGMTDMIEVKVVSAKAVKTE